MVVNLSNKISSKNIIPSKIVKVKLFSIKTYPKVRFRNTFLFPFHWLPKK